MVGGVWNGFLLGRVRGQAVPCRFCGAPDNDGHLFWDCPFPPLVEIRENPEFHDLMRMDKARVGARVFLHFLVPPCAVNSSERIFNALILLYASVLKVALNYFNVPCSNRRTSTCDISFGMEHRRLRL